MHIEKECGLRCSLLIRQHSTMRYSTVRYGKVQRSASLCCDRFLLCFAAGVWIRFGSVSFQFQFQTKDERPILIIRSTITSILFHQPTLLRRTVVLPENNCTVVFLSMGSTMEFMNVHVSVLRRWIPLNTYGTCLVLLRSRSIIIYRIYLLYYFFKYFISARMREIRKHNIIHFWRSFQ